MRYEVYPLAYVEAEGRWAPRQPRLAAFEEARAARLAEESIYDLLAPVERVTGYDTHIPLFRLEMKYLPSVERIVAAAKRAVAAG